MVRNLKWGLAEFAPPTGCKTVLGSGKLPVSHGQNFNFASIHTGLFALDGLLTKIYDMA
jgi:hypothetical protein